MGTVEWDIIWDTNSEYIHKLYSIISPNVFQQFMVQWHPGHLVNVVTILNPKVIGQCRAGDQILGRLHSLSTEEQSLSYWMRGIGCEVLWDIWYHDHHQIEITDYAYAWL